MPLSPLVFASQKERPDHSFDPTAGVALHQLSTWAGDGLIQMLGPMRIIIAIVPLLALLAPPCCAQDGHAIFNVDRNVLDCSPKHLKLGGTLRLQLAPDHGRELAIRRNSDNAWFYLVVESPPPDMKQFMPVEAFRIASHVDIPATARAVEWESGHDAQPIFASAGSYDLFVSENMESDAGGFKCTVHVSAHGPK